jgi:hypothetical protein
MAAKFCLQDFNQLVDVCCGGLFSNLYCVAYHKFPGNKSGNGKPGEEFENGINQLTVNRKSS